MLNLDSVYYNYNIRKITGLMKLTKSVQIYLQLSHQVLHYAAPIFRAKSKRPERQQHMHQGR
jgi:hypothetical protein